MPQKILVVDDEQPILESLSYNLKKEGYQVYTARDGDTALKLARTILPDLIILDLMLPGLSGIEVCKILQKEERNIPVIMLTAKDREIDKVIGLEIGADDYVTKPFSLPELIARVKAVIRRTKLAKDKKYESEIVKIDTLVIDFSRYKVWVKNKEVYLSPKEFELLKVLVRNSGRVLTRDMLLDYVWGDNFKRDDKTLDVHIRWLREKIEKDPSSPDLILTIRGVGYKFKEIK